MSLSPEHRAAMLAATKEAASAFLEDIQHIRKLLSDKQTPRAEVRYLATTLRRLLVNRELSEISAPRIGRLELLVPDNKPYYKIENIAPYQFFASGGAPCFGPKLRPIMGRTGTPKSIARERALLSDEIAEATVQARLDGFLSQRVLCLHSEWATRQQVIKFVANIASGAHSGSPHATDEILIAKCRNAVEISTDGQNVTTKIKNVPDYNFATDFAHSPNSIDIVLHELLSAAYYLNESPDIAALEAYIKKELSGEAT